MAWFDFLNPVFNPLLQLGPFWALFILSLIISAVITLVYKLLTDQKRMKELKDEQKELQTKMKSLKDNPQEMIKVQKDAMKKNFEYMKSSFKPTLVTMIPIIIIFGWMTAHLSYEPIYPGETYSITAGFEKGTIGNVTLIPDNTTQLLSPSNQEINTEVNWKLKSSNEGIHILDVKLNNQSFSKKVLITKNLTSYEDPITLIQHSEIKQIKVNYIKLKPLGPTFNLFGWYPGWLAIYIVLSLVFSIGLRKALKIY